MEEEEVGRKNEKSMNKEKVFAEVRWFEVSQEYDPRRRASKTELKKENKACRYKSEFSLYMFCACRLRKDESWR